MSRINGYYALHAKLAMVEPSDSQECLDYIKEAFLRFLEKFDTPVLFRVTTRICHSKTLVETDDKKRSCRKRVCKDAGEIYYGSGSG